MEKTIVIISKVDIISGNTAAGARMLNYARALADKNKVYLLSFGRLQNKNYFIEIENNIYTLKSDSYRDVRYYNLFQTLKVYFRFFKFLTHITGEKFIINYPTLDSFIFDFLILIKFRSISFVEINEVRKFTSEKSRWLIKRLQSAFFSTIGEKLIPYYKGVFFISNNIREYYAKRNNNSIVIPILSSISIQTPIVKKKKNESLTFIFMGTISFAKENLEELIKGFKQFSSINNNSQLLFYGSLSKINHRKLNNILENLELNRKIQYKGIINHDAVQEVLRKADCLLLPRNNNKQNYYGFSTKLSEYAISGTPIIMTKTGVIADFFTNGENCLICNGYDSTAFVEKMQEFNKLNQLERNELADNAFITAKKFFYFENYKDTINSFLK